VCTAENVGCLWYAIAYDAAGEWDASSRRYFNRNVESCDAENEGCTELVDFETAGANLIHNGSFERDDDGGSVPDGWVFAPNQGAAYVQGGAAAHGRSAVRVGVTQSGVASVDQRLIPIIPGVRYTISMSALVDQVSGGTLRSKMFLTNKSEGKLDVVDIESMDSTCTKSDSSESAINLYAREVTQAVRESCSFVAPPNSGLLRVTLMSIGQTTLADAIQLERGSSATPFREGYAENAPRTHLKVAPDDRRCYDLAGNGALRTDNDDASCSSFAQGCVEADVGCEAYSPSDGSPLVNGTVRTIDRCPNACIGYSAYREVDSNFDKKDSFDYFIPATARACTAESVGCSEFTNLDAAFGGGESREYFSSLRRCEKPNEPGIENATFYTWEGSESEGYQIQKFVLQSEGSLATLRPFTTEGYDCVGNYNKRPGTTGFDSEITPDCRAFYNQSGTIFYRRLSKTVLITDSCVRYRPTHLIDEPTCTSAGSGGTWNATTGCIFKGFAEQSTSCTQAFNGCRAYRGNEAGALQTIMASDFEPEKDGWTSGNIEAESVRAGGHSLKLNDGVTSTRQLNAGTDAAPSAMLRANSTYELILVGKGSGALTTTIVNTSDERIDRADTLVAAFSPTWRRQVIGPIQIPSGTTLSGTEKLKFVVSGGTIFIDSILLRETPTLVYGIKNSWQTPASCDRASVAPNAAPQPQGMLGCRAYETRTGDDVALRSFSRLCSESVVGCRAFYDTKNSLERYARQFQISGAPEDDVTIPADSIRYLVDQPEARCEATAASCRAFGKPVLKRTDPAAQGEIQDYEDVYLMDAPSRYEGANPILCKDEALFCEEFRDNSGSSTFFKHPLGRTCEYRENVTIGGIVYDGWFQDGTDATPCDDTLIISGKEFGIRRNGDADYDERVGRCNPSYDRCTALRDATDQTIAHPDGELYSVIRDNDLDLATCTGGVSRQDGCVLLDDTELPTKRWSTSATYAVSDAASGRRVAPIDCTAQPDECQRCTVVKKCRDSSGAVQPSGPATCADSAQCDQAAGFTCTGGDVGPTCTGNIGATGSCDGFATEATCEQFTNDANLIVKVQRDRQCSQWIEKDGCYQAWVPDVGRSVERCTSIRRAGQGSVPGSVNTGNIDLASYQQRDRTWFGLEPTGLSIPNAPPIDALEQVKTYACKGLPELGLYPNFPYSQACLPRNTYATQGARWDCEGYATCEEVIRLAYVSGACASASNPYTRCDAELPEFRGDGKNQSGICTLDQRCAYGITAPGDGFEATFRENRIASWPAPRCKILPDKDAPFPSTVFQAAVASPGYGQANICENGDCSCEYTKATYSGKVKFFSGTQRGALRRFSVEDDDFCADADNSDPNCKPPTKIEHLRGILGYCLEEDRTQHIQGSDSLFACQTFWPVDQLSGQTDVFTELPSATIELASNVQWYCADKAEGSSANSIRAYRKDSLPATALSVQIGSFMTPFRDLRSTSYQSAQNTPQLFGPPSQIPNGFQSQVGGLYNPQLATSGPFNATFQGPNSKGACRKNENSGWCILPASGQHGDVPSSYGRGGVSCDSRCFAGNYNFFGCYEFPDRYSSVVFYPWNDLGNMDYWEHNEFSGTYMAPIYEWQIERITVRLPNSDTSARCKKFTRDNGDNSSARTGAFDLTERYNDTDSSKPTVWYGGTEGGGADQVKLHAMFDKDNDDRFLGMVVEASDANDEGTIFISGIDIIMKDGCQQVVNVVDQERHAGYTNQLWAGSNLLLAPGSPSRNAYGQNTGTAPWGGIAEAQDSSGLWPAGRTYVTEGTQGQSYTGAAYQFFNGVSEVAQLFARSFQIFGLTKKDGTRDGITVNNIQSVCDSGEYRGEICTGDDQCRYSLSSGAQCISSSGKRKMCWGLTQDNGNNGLFCTDQTKEDNCGALYDCKDPKICNAASGEFTGEWCAEDSHCGLGRCVDEKVCVNGDTEKIGDRCVQKIDCWNDPGAPLSDDDYCKKSKDIDEEWAPRCQVDRVSGGTDRLSCDASTISKDCTNTTAKCIPMKSISNPDQLVVPFTYTDPVFVSSQWDNRIRDGVPPTVTAAVRCDPLSDACEEGTEGTITINGQSEDDVIANGGELRAEMRFFYHANENQMPIRSLVAQWGANPKTEGQYDNSGGSTLPSIGNLRGTGKCDNTTFGTAENIACLEKVFVFTHTYSCNGQGSLDLCTGSRPPDGETACWDPGYRTKGACIFTPRVHIKDNWGFCTGKCPGGPAGDDCFDGETLSRNYSDAERANECDMDLPDLVSPNIDPWTYFNGRVIVTPP
jgi:hypothetical protein